MDAIAEQLAAAVGLGGRDRRSSSGAERARSAVTKRIKEAINRIGAVIPPLGLPLGRENQDGILLLLQSAPGSSRRLEVLIFRAFPPL